MLFLVTSNEFIVQGSKNKKDLIKRGEVFLGIYSRSMSASVPSKK